MQKRPKLQRHELHFHIPFSKLPRYLENLKAQKLSLEVYFSAHDLDGLSEQSLGLLENLNYNPSITVHGPFMDLNPGAVDPLVREVTLSRFKDTLNIARKLKARMVVFHSGYERWKYAHKIQPWLQASIQTWTELAPLLQEYDLHVAVENIFEDGYENLVALMEELKNPRIGLCFDTGHFNLFSRVPLQEWLEATGTYIKELHLHDNDSSFDSHLAPSKGTFDFDKLFSFLQARSLRPVFTVEAHSEEDVMEALRYFNV